jgi:Peptidase propeptide and YPEB domain
MVPTGAWGGGAMKADYFRLWPSRWPAWLRSLLCAALVLGADVQRLEVRAEQELSREQAVALVQKRYGARVVRAELLNQDGRHLYVFRLLSAAGKVWIVRVDARTGTEVP